ncbi:MAG: ATP-binding cassette domain-containing protein [Eubacterium sp.]|nr:ATP-binding cassette domain-containing protein [Eubacterium sp.]
MSELVISIEGLEKNYGTKMVLKDVNMHINKGDLYGVIGKNGAGKTTLFKTILGLSTFEKGKISILGGKDENENRINRQHIGFFVGANFYDYLSGRENLHYFRRLKGIEDKAEVDRVLKLVGLDNDAANVPAKKYSLGMKQRLGIANAMLGNPDIMIFDEPTNGLDPQGIHDIRTMLKRLNEEEGKTIIVSSHILSELENTADRFGIIHEGVVMKELSQDDFKTQKDITSINISDSDVDKATKLLSENGIKVIGTEKAKVSLEDYYFNLIGGDQDA